MNLKKGVVMLGVAKKLYAEAQKPENQRRMREAADKVKTKVEERRKR